MSSLIRVLLAMICISFATSLDIDLRSVYKNLPNLTRFWTSTGFSPPTNQVREYLFSKDMEINLALMGSLPKNGLTHVRIHWLLDLVTQSSTDSNQTKYSFSDLENFLSDLQSNGLSPGFELMGSPANLNKLTGNLDEWERFLHLLLQRSLLRFGEKYVKTWRFESLNEPDLQQYNVWNLNLTEYIKYVAVSASVLNRYNIQLWGPAGLFKEGKQHVRCWGLLQYCSENNDCPISVLSFHKKGQGRASQIIDESKALVEKIRTDYSWTRQMPMSNNEADPLTGWWRPVQWRSDVRYAAAVVQTVIGFEYLRQTTEISLAAVSNDNGFLSYGPYYWIQRTLLARMEMNNTSPPHTQLLKKPVYSAMSLLSLIGNKTAYLSYSPGQSGLSILATFEGKRRVILLTLANDILNTTLDHHKHRIDLSITLDPDPGGQRVMIYLLDNVVTNPERVWRRAGSNPFPNRTLRRKIRRQGEAFEKQSITLDPLQTSLKLKMALRVPSVILINICSCSESSPGPVNNVRYINITDNEILLFWSDAQVGSRCLSTYEVEFCPIGERMSQKISTYHFFTNSFHYDGCRENSTIEDIASIEGEYTITPVDYCNRKGPPVRIKVY